MSVLNSHLSKSRSVCFGLVSLLALALIAVSCNQPKSNQTTVEQKTFASPEAAGEALFDAAKTGDQHALLSIFGPDGSELIFSGDAVKDKNAANAFVSSYQQMNRWSKRESGEEVLYVGADNLTFPIPLKQNSAGRWAFDSGVGRDEILARRIGDGELTAIGVLTEIANAQQEYFAEKHEFAQKILSDEGQQDGLYWPAVGGQKPSPLDPLAQVAKALGYSRSNSPQPFNGYYYQILTKERDPEKTEVKEYTEKGRLTNFAVLAWPARYRDSGIMTFEVGQDGVIRQKDLGDKTAQAPADITAYDPSWAVVLAPDSATASAGHPDSMD